MTRALTADYVVVGAGSAGAALAARLSEDPSVSIVLLEAGGPDRAVELHVPAAFSRLFRGPYDWGYDTVPQPHLDGRRVFWPRGRTLGGSSSPSHPSSVRGRSDPAPGPHRPTPGSARHPKPELLKTGPDAASNRPFRPIQLRI